MKKEGYLNKIHEVKEFWDFITVPKNLEDVMEDGKNHRDIVNYFPNFLFENKSIQSCFNSQTTYKSFISFSFFLSPILID